MNEKTFRAGESVTMAEIVKTEMQYTFTDGTMIVFMNMETFEEVRIDKSKFESNQIQLLKEGRFGISACLMYCILSRVLTVLSVCHYARLINRNRTELSRRRMER